MTTDIINILLGASAAVFSAFVTVKVMLARLEERQKALKEIVETSLSSTVTKEIIDMIVDNAVARYGRLEQRVEKLEERK